MSRSSSKSSRNLKLFQKKNKTLKIQDKIPHLLFSTFKMDTKLGEHHTAPGGLAPAHLQAAPHTALSKAGAYLPSPHCHLDAPGSS